MSDFEKLPKTPVTAPPDKEIATIAGGCFWCVEAIYTDLRGVESVMPGYSGGHVPNPTYKTVCAGVTGHAEAIQIVFDPAQLSYHDLLSIFFTVHDPTTLNRQGNDVGTQYRSAIYTHSPEQDAVARQVISEIDDQKIWHAPIVTEVTPFVNFYDAEAYHRDYYALHPMQGYCQVVIAPKVAKFRSHYQDMLRP